LVVPFFFAGVGCEAPGVAGSGDPADWANAEPPRASVMIVAPVKIVFLMNPPFIETVTLVSLGTTRAPATAPAHDESTAVRSCTVG
jgi:hypothetical protein